MIRGTNARHAEICWSQIAWCITLVLLHFWLIFMALIVCRALPLMAAPLGLFVFAVFFARVSFANAKYLVHHSNRYFHQLGALVYASLLFGHRASSEILVHHIHLATPHDPNTAKLGENIYQFVIPAWVGSYMAGLRGENKRRMAFNRGQVDQIHPYLKYWLVPLVIGILIYQLMDGGALVMYITLSVLTQLLTLLCDYVQHYGLSRDRDHFKRYLPVEQQHHWVAPCWMTICIDAHSDGSPSPHHLRNQSPHLPFTMLTMMFICLFPRWFQPLMQPRLRDWQRMKRS
ncbi:hypothetical protein [Paramylibacter ulvae]|uniref:hypothetical protein n=1 Tax=Paramylibacter ulvae TaxID=1651968 RepID=UPI001E60727D|nr:hypothetical protein [Amylibacter ulvae]